MAGSNFQAKNYDSRIKIYPGLETLEHLCGRFFHCLQIKRALNNLIDPYSHEMVLMFVVEFNNSRGFFKSLDSGIALGILENIFDSLVFP